MSLISGSLRQLELLKHKSVGQQKELMQLAEGDSRSFLLQKLLEDSMDESFTIGRNGALLEAHMAGNKEVEIILPNTDALAIVRIFLEKYEQLTADERKEILTVIRLLSNPVIKVTPDVSNVRP